MNAAETHIICLHEYFGLSDYFYGIECTGRQLAEEEIDTQNLFTEEMKKAHRESSYGLYFFEVKEGDQIIIKETNFDPEDNCDTRIVTSTFEIPANLSGHPKNCDEIIGGAGGLTTQLEKCCKLIDRSIDE